MSPKGTIRGAPQPSPFFQSHSNMWSEKIFPNGMSSPFSLNSSWILARLSNSPRSVLVSFEN